MQYAQTGTGSARRFAPVHRGMSDSIVGATPTSPTNYAPVTRQIWYSHYV